MGGKRRTIEADNTYADAKRANMHNEKQARIRPGSTHKLQVVFGMLERKTDEVPSHVRRAHIQATRQYELQQHIRANIQHGSTPRTDAHSSYRRSVAISVGEDFIYHAIDHAVAYVDGHVHTNGNENFWRPRERTVKGAYVSVNPIRL